MTLNIFLEIVGTWNNLSKVKVTLGLKGEENEVKPINWIGKPLPLPIMIWSKPLKGAHYWMFWAFDVTWCEAFESRNQLLEELVKVPARIT